MAIFASDWVEGTSPELEQFDFVFLVALRSVDDNSSLEKIITKQHGLGGKDIEEGEIKSILRVSKVLLLLDGYDEYKKGTNRYIDEAIEDTIGDCCLILTSRDGGYIDNETLDKMDVEIEITGFSKESIQKYAALYLESEELAKDLIDKATIMKIQNLLRIPILLLMTCIVYEEDEHQLPGTQIEIISRMMEILMDRSTLKHFGKEAKDIVGLENLLYKLGELSLEALQRDTKQLLLSKVNAILLLYHV